MPLRITGYFNCSMNKLVTLQGCPKSVGYFFESHNNIREFTIEEKLKVCEIKNRADSAFSTK
jgi:hypothetical protein